MNIKLSKEAILRLSYTDFIGLINQTNVPPGSFSTINKWKVNSNLSKDSNIIEVACSTGFSILNIVKDTGVNGTGVDISNISIEQAKRNAIRMKLEDRVSFYHANATTFETRECYSHIIVGASLGFFDKPDIMINKIVKISNDVSYILASPFYLIREMPGDIISDAKRILGITPTIKNYKEVMKLYRNFDVQYEDRLYSIPETEEELVHYCHSTITRAYQEQQIVDRSLYDVLYKRLYEIRTVCNKIRRYQNYSVLVLKYDRSYYPNRYVELF